LAISTSGNAKNCLEAVKTGKINGDHDHWHDRRALAVILANLSDITISRPAKTAFRIQESQPGILTLSRELVENALP